MEVNKIREENNKKIIENEVLLNTVEVEINNLYLKRHKLFVRYNKNQKEFKKMKKTINIGCTSFFTCLIIPVFIQSTMAGLSVSILYGSWLLISNKALNKMHKQDNEKDKCNDLAQINISNEITEKEKLKNKIENSLFVRNVINAILDNQYIALTELEAISNFFNNDDILTDFNMNEYNILNDYYNNYKKELTLNNYSNGFTKEKVKIKK